MLQLMAERKIDVTRKPASADDLAGLSDELFIQGEGDFLGGRGGILPRVGFKSNPAPPEIHFPSHPMIAVARIGNARSTLDVGIIRCLLDCSWC